MNRMSRYIDQDKVIDAVLELDTTHRVSWQDAVIDMIDAMASENVQPDTKELIAKIKNGISATNADDVYSCGMRNGMRWVLSLIDGKEPLFESARNAADVQPVVLCKDCVYWSSKETKYCNMLKGTFQENDYCSYGERKGAECT